MSVKFSNTNENNNGNNSKNFSILKKIPLIIIALFAIGFSLFIIKYGPGFTVDKLLEYVPDNMALAATVLLFLFALKSLSVFFPLSVLYLASGLLFPNFLAVIISTIGLLTTISIPYVIGRYYGSNLIQSIADKYPAISKLENYQNENQIFSCFITRFVGFLPCDILSLYFGAFKIPYGKYLFAGFLGSFLSISTTTLLGTQLSNILSKEFLIILSIRILVSILSLVGHRKLTKKTASK